MPIPPEKKNAIKTDVKDTIAGQPIIADAI